MPYLPTIQSKLSVINPVPETQVSPNAFGYQKGQALQELGQDIGRAASEWDNYGREEAARQRAEDIANRSAQAQPELARIALQAQQDAPPDGSGVVQTTLNSQRDYIRTATADIKDPETRTKLSTQLTGDSARYGVTATEFQFRQNQQYSRDQANQSLNITENLVRSDPSQYDVGLEKSFAVIDARPGIGAVMKENMKAGARQRMAYARFDGMLASAKSVQDFDNIEHQLTTAGGGKDWREEFAGDKSERNQSGDSMYGKMLQDVQSARKTFQTALGGKVRTYLQDFDARTNDLSQIPDADINDAVSMAENTGDSVLIRQANRLKRNQYMLKHEGQLPPEEVQGRLNESKGGPSQLMKGLPPELNNSINEANKVYPNVSPSYLGGTAQKEYGEHLRKGTQSRGNPSYAPRSIHSGVDLRNMNPQVVDAATVAGEIMGVPLPITSGFRSQAKQDSLRAANPAGAAAGRIAKHGHHQEGDAIDVSTMGMDMAKQTKLVDALAQAGFTGFGWYKGHIHADMRQAVPNSFGGNWGGWTDIPDPLMNVLNKRGFAANKSAREIDRSGDFQVADLSGRVDYGQGTSIKGPDGKPTSSATGVFQFTDDTWLGLARDGKTAQRIGMPIEGKSDAELLELRKDPRYSTLMAAALADQNKTALEATLGRPIDDSEMYMAHVLGAPGATALINAANRNPNASAVDLLPAAAEANRAIFYSGDRPRTAKEVYDNIGVRFSTEPNQVAYGDAKYREKMLTNMRTQTKENLVGFIKTQGNFPVQPLDVAGGFTMRASTVANASDFYNIPIPETKPFDQDEAAALSKTIKEGTPAEQLGLMASIQSMDAVRPGLAKAAYKQLGEEDSVNAYAASLMYGRGNVTAAQDIIRGQKRMTQDPDGMKGRLGTDNQAVKDFDSYMGLALNGVKPEVVASMRKAAMALYIQRNPEQATYDSSLFQKAIDDTLGGKDTIAELNDVKVPVPPGTDAPTFEKAFNSLNDQDLIRLSLDGNPPRHANGDFITAEEIQTEGKLRYIGASQYKIELADRTFASTLERDPQLPGAYKYYVFNADAKAVNEIANRPKEQAAQIVYPDMSPEAQSARSLQIQKDAYARSIEGRSIRGSKAYMVGQPEGLVQMGNIDLMDRPVVNNPDGSISTVRSMSFNVEGKEVLIPTVSDDGRILSDKEAIEQFAKTGRHLGKFNSPDAATKYAMSLHDEQAKMYAKR